MSKIADNIGYRNFTSFHKLKLGSELLWTKGQDQVVDLIVKTNYDVVSTINSYSGSKDMVYDKGSSKWYFRNNLGNYEEYGIIELIDNINNATKYLGKLVYNRADNHEYEWNGVEWVDLGAATLLSQYATFDGNSYFDTELHYDSNTSIEAYFNTSTITSIKSSFFGAGQTKVSGSSILGQTFKVSLYNTNSTNYLYIDYACAEGWGGAFLPVYTNKNYKLDFRKTDLNTVTLYDLDDGTSSSISVSGRTLILYNDLTLFIGANNKDNSEVNYYYKGIISNIKIYNNNVLQRDLVFRKVSGVGKMYDTITGTYYNNLGTGAITITELHSYPKEYSTLFTPSVTISKQSIADLYSYEFPYIGLAGTINSSDYILNSSSLWEYQPYVDYSVQPFGIHAYDGDLIVKLIVEAYSTYTSPTLYYSYDMTTWNTWTNVYSELTINDGQTLYLYGPDNNIFSNSDSVGSPGAYKHYLQFNGTGKAKLTGQFLSLYNTNYATLPKSISTSNSLKAHFFSFFSNKNYIYDISNLHINISVCGTGASYNICFGYLFTNNVNITKGCVFDRSFTGYGYAAFIVMYNNCTSLQEAEIPPMNSNIDRTFEGIFSGCPLLTKVIYRGQAPFGSNAGLQSTTPGIFYNLNGASLSIPSNWTVKTQLD